MQPTTTRIALLAASVVMAAMLVGGSWYIAISTGCRAIVQLQRVDAGALIPLGLSGAAQLCQRLVG